MKRIWLVYFWCEYQTLGRLKQLFCNHEFITEPRSYAYSGIRFCKKCGKISNGEHQTTSTTWRG